MLTPKDVQNIIKANREVFATKEDLAGLEQRTNENLTGLEQRADDKLNSFREEVRQDFDKLMTAVDAYATKAESFFQELVVANHKIERHEKWLHQIAEKLGVRLEY